MGGGRDKVREGGREGGSVVGDDEEEARERERRGREGEREEGEIDLGREGRTTKVGEMEGGKVGKLGRIWRREGERDGGGNGGRKRRGRGA